jgi:hypothetical protein
MRLLLPIVLLTLAACQPVSEIRRRVDAWRGVEAPADASAIAEVPPVVLPTIEEDKVVQFDPRERVLAMIDQFNRAPDATAGELLLQELVKQRTVFGEKRDAAFVSALSGLMPHLQTQEVVAVHLLVRMVPLLQGENQRHAQVMVGRALDHAPALAMTALAKAATDPQCTPALIVPEDVPADEKLVFLENRRAALDSARPALAQNPAALNLLDTCYRNLQNVLPPPPASGYDNP